jgi:hypothetical protein
MALWRFCLPPLSDRLAHTGASRPFGNVPSLLMVLAAHIRLRHPDTPNYLRVVLLLVLIPINFHLYMKRYHVGVWYDASGIPLTTIHVNFLIGMGIGTSALKLIDMLLVGRDEEFYVKDAVEYRRTLPAIEIEKEDKAYSLDKPKRFPGCSIPLEVDLVFSMRGTGYGWGPKESEAGYKALMKAEKLALGEPILATQEKRAHIKRVGKTLLLCFVLVDICDSIVKQPKLFPPAARLGGGPLVEARDGIFGWLGPWFSEW